MDGGKLFEDFRFSRRVFEPNSRENRETNACVKHDKDWNEETEVIEK